MRDKVQKVGLGLVHDLQSRVRLDEFPGAGLDHLLQIDAMLLDCSLEPI